VIGSLITLAIAIFTVGLVIAWVRRGTIREKYAVLWLFLGAVTIVLSGFPQILQWASQQLGVVVPANLIFAMAILLLVGVALHLSWELSTVEDEARVLAEESAMLRNSLEQLQTDVEQLKSLTHQAQGQLPSTDV
jgi:hypothetical protein